MEDGDRDFSFYCKPEADMMLGVDDFNEEMNRNCRIFHFPTLSMTAEDCRKATKKVIEIAKEAGAIISFDPNLREPLWDRPEATRQWFQHLSRKTPLK